MKRKNQIGLVCEVNRVKKTRDDSENSSSIVIVFGCNHRVIGRKAQKRGIRNGGYMGPEVPIEKRSSFNALMREAGGAQCWNVTERNPSVISRSP